MKMNKENSRNQEFYKIEYHFSRTDEYFGVCTEDESDWLFRVER